MRGFGFQQFRVRYYEDCARVEIALSELPRAREMKLAALLAELYAAIGFARIELDPRGYRQGSLNEALLSPASRA